MTFTLETWQQEVAERLSDSGDWLKDRKKEKGSFRLYAALCAIGLFPLIEAAQKGQLVPAIMTLGSIAGGVGGNLIAEQVQLWKDQPDEKKVIRWVIEDAETNLGLRDALDDVLKHLNIIARVLATLNKKDRQWFIAVLREELFQLGNLTEFEPILIGSGAIAQAGSVAAGARGVAVGGDVHGDIVITGGSHVAQVSGDVMAAGRDVVKADYLMTPAEIRRILEDAFDIEELKTLAFDLNLEYDTLPGTSSSAKIREMVAHFWRKEELDVLVQAIDAHRPGLLVERVPLWKAWDQISTGLGKFDCPDSTENSWIVARGISKALGLPLLDHKPYVRNHLWCYWLDTATVFSNTRLPTALPLILLHRLELQESDLHDLAQLVSEKLGESRHIALLLLFGEGEPLARSQALASAKGQRILGYDIVLIDRREMQKLILAREPQITLRHIILKHVDLVSVSPYTITGPASDNVFFGRELELRNIVEHRSTTSYAVIGGRRVGKTSLLGRLHRVRLPATGTFTLYHDCSTTPSCDTFLAATVRDWRPQPPVADTITLGALFRSATIGRPLILLLDEVDKLIPSERKGGWRLFNLLRSIASSGRAQFVLSGERTLRGALQDPASPLFNFANEILLGPLEYGAVEELVTRPMMQLEVELVDEKAIVDRIFDFTSGHPNVVQRLCHRLINKLNRRDTRQITLRDVNAIIEDPQFQEVDFLQTFWEAASPLERIITLVLSEKTGTYRPKTVRQLLYQQAGIQAGVAVTKDALDRLIHLRSILKRTQDGYTFAVTAFPLVLANTTTVADLLESLVEQYYQSEDQV